MEHWNVLSIRSNQEEIAERDLAARSIRSYVPRLQGDQARKAPRGLIFPGFLFVQPAPEQVPELRTIRGSWGPIAFAGRPGIVTRPEIDGMEAMLRSRLGVEVHAFLQVGQGVEVISGPLAGLVGKLLQVRGRNRLVMNVTILKQSLSVEINAESVRPVLESMVAKK